MDKKLEVLLPVEILSLSLIHKFTQIYGTQIYTLHTKMSLALSRTSLSFSSLILSFSLSLNTRYTESIKTRSMDKCLDTHVRNDEKSVFNHAPLHENKHWRKREKM